MKIYEALEKDHKHLKHLLNKLVALKDDDELRFFFIEQIRRLLFSHARAEESVFYNTLQEVDAVKNIILHGYQAHLEAESLLRSLQVMNKMNLSWKGTAKKLKDKLEEHFEEEETGIFDEARSAFSDLEAEAIGVSFNELRQKIEQDGVLTSTFDLN